MLNINKTYQRAHGDIDVRIKNNQISKFFQSGSAKVFYPKCHDKIKELVLVNTAGGLTSGDKFSYKIDINNQSSVFVTTQTAERAYKGLENSSKIKVELSIDRFSNLYWIPQELILFNNCNLQRNINVNVNGSSNFLLAETTIFGRTAMGEYLEEGTFIDNWRIYENTKLLHAEALSLNGNIKEQLSKIASTNGGVAICNIFVCGKKFLHNENELKKYIINTDTVLLSHSAWNDKLLIRMVAQNAYDLKKIQKKILLCLSNNSLPKVWNN
tara:strand:+ start:588 stop:1397 length:810 start_codon:yes stop_codon:yes gene_type:complete